MIDESRDEVRLAGVIERLCARWQFSADSQVHASEPRRVDVPSTNEALVLGSRPLERFTAIAPGDPRVPLIEHLPMPKQSITPEQIIVVLLCGGLGTRGGGKVHPLLPIQAPDGPHTRTLLDAQLDRLTGSCLAGAATCVLGSLFNESALREHLIRLPSERRPRLYTGGLVPRLALKQPDAGSAILHQSRSGERSYNPAGHLDALRWLVGSGLLVDMLDAKVILIASYSNGGRIFTREALALAAHTAERGSQDPCVLCFVETVSKPREKSAGSLLVTTADAPTDMRLVKYGYGRNSPQLPAGNEVLMSSNTLYFSVDCLLRRLLDATPAVGLTPSRDGLAKCLHDAVGGSRRDKALALFDGAFPVEPKLTIKRTPEGEDVLQAERDLDQLTLLPGPSSFEAVVVGHERAVSIKRLADLEDPSKRPYLLA